MYFFRGIINNAVNLIYIIILIRVLLSWIPVDRNNSFVQIIFQITEPMLVPFRTLQQKLGIGGSLDFSPIFLLIVIKIIASLLLR